MQSKTTMRYDYVLIILPKNNNKLLIPSLARMQSNWNCHTLLVGMENSTVTLEKSLAVFYKMKCTFTMQPGNPTPRYLPKLERKLCSHKNCMWIFIVASLTISKILETTQMSFSQGMNKLCYIHTTECYSAIKRKELLILTRTWMNGKCIKLREKSDSKSLRLCNFISMTFCNRQHCRDRKQTSNLQGGGFAQKGTWRIKSRSVGLSH